MRNNQLVRTFLWPNLKFLYVHVRRVGGCGDRRNTICSSMSATPLNKNNSGMLSFSSFLSLLRVSFVHSRQENPPRGKRTRKRPVYRLHCRTARGLSYPPSIHRQLFTYLILGRHIRELHPNFVLSHGVFISKPKEWHCTIRGPAGTEFEGGLYHFRILLPSEYPFRPPSILMLTPNGRFELNTKACFPFPVVAARSLIPIPDLYQLHQLCVPLFRRQEIASPFDDRYSPFNRSRRVVATCLGC